MLSGTLVGARVKTCDLIFERNRIPPTINQEAADPECDLDFIPNVAPECDVHYTLTNSFGFGGHNVSILFRRFEE